MSNDREHLAILAAKLALCAKEPLPAHLIAQDAMLLIRIGRAAANQAVRYCNGEGHYDTTQHRMVWDETDDARWEKRREKQRKQAQEIADRYSARVELGGDPRGYILKLHFPDKAANELGGAWGVA